MDGGPGPAADDRLPGNGILGEPNLANFALSAKHGGAPGNESPQESEDPVPGIKIRPNENKNLHLWHVVKGLEHPTQTTTTTPGYEI